MELSGFEDAVLMMAHLQLAGNDILPVITDVYKLRSKLYIALILLDI